MPRKRPGRSASRPVRSGRHRHGAEGDVHPRMRTGRPSTHALHRDRRSRGARRPRPAGRPPPPHAVRQVGDDPDSPGNRPAPRARQASASRTRGGSRSGIDEHRQRFALRYDANALGHVGPWKRPLHPEHPMGSANTLGNCPASDRASSPSCGAPPRGSRRRAGGAGPWPPGRRPGPIAIASADPARGGRGPAGPRRSSEDPVTARHGGGRYCWRPKATPSGRTIPGTASTRCAIRRPRYRSLLPGPPGSCR